MKSLIVEHLGHAELLLPSLISKGLAANDRAKFRMAVLQALTRQTRAGGPAGLDMSAECRSAGVDEEPIRALIRDARASGGKVAAPGLAKLTEELRGDVEAMLEAVSAGDPEAGRQGSGRWLAMRDTAQAPADEIAAATVSALTSVPQAGGDSLHRLVMDLHKDLNRLAAACAEETVQGAHAFGLTAEDRAQVAAFMRGLDRTRALKFHHPGLDTSAARSESRLIIQNDIGTTDAHVLVVAIEGAAITVTHTDVHRARAKFFISLLDRFAVHWSGLDERSAQSISGGFFFITGRYEAESAERRDSFLETLGASLVYLIDWNKARKDLRTLADKKDCDRILEWAARTEVGHRAYLELGGSALVSAAVRHAAPGRIGFGERLADALGREQAADFLKTVLRVSREALSRGSSPRVVRDEIEADLVRRFERVDNALLTAIVRQAGLAREIAARIGRHLAAQQAGVASDGPALAVLAQRIEQKADRLVVEIRNTVARLDAGPTMLQLANTLESAIDELEQAAFIASLLPPHLDPAVLRLIAELCGAAVAGAEALASGIAAAVDVPEGHHVDTEEALAAITRLADLEHAADAVERSATACVLRGHFETETALSVLELSRILERTNDAMAVAGNLLHAHVMKHLCV